MTLPALHIVHDELRQVSPEAIREIAELLELHPAEVHDTMSFYGFFREPTARWESSGSGSAGAFPACFAAARNCWQNLCEKWHVESGPNVGRRSVSLEYAECLGACEGAPCILVDDECHMNVSEEDVARIVGKQ